MVVVATILERCSAAHEAAANPVMSVSALLLVVGSRRRVLRRPRTAIYAEELRHVTPVGAEAKQRTQK
jgi:uncharacterized protein (TIGR03382 family)